MSYVAIVASEPIEGVPSHRIYGTYPTSNHAWAALIEAGIWEDGKPADEWVLAGVLPLRAVETLSKERP